MHQMTKGIEVSKNAFDVQYTTSIKKIINRILDGFFLRQYVKVLVRFQEISYINFNQKRGNIARISINGKEIIRIQ